MSLNAKIYDHNECLLPAREERKRSVALPDSRLIGSFKTFCLLIGIMVGFFIQCSTLGANFLIITLWGEEIISKSKQDIVVFSLMWSFFTSILAVIILGFLRNLITLTYNAVSPTDGNLEQMILHMECRFVVGALVGVCTAWTITDSILGMRAQIMYSIITLFASLLWCRYMTNNFTAEYGDSSQEADEEQEGGAKEYYIMTV